MMWCSAPYINPYILRLTIKKEKKGADGYVWYKVSFKYNGKTKTGYVRSDFVKITEETK